MCGIAGLWALKGEHSESLRDHLEAMTSVLQHRGPDDSGVWIDDESALGLGFRRLAIIDLSPQGHQPMISADGRWVMVFNGEVYNFAELRQELRTAGRTFRGASDSEVILEGFSEWGVRHAAGKFIGMFAIGLWDRREHCLHLIRDRLGIKPVYYGWAQRTFVFGSELKAFRAHPEFNAMVDRDALTLYMRHNCVPAPHSIYKNACKLLPGHILSLAADGNIQDHCYWDARRVAVEGLSQATPVGDGEAIRQLDALLRDSVRRRMVSDVPLGAFLSGGIDSSTVTALMQAQSDRPVRTFTVGFREDGFDEARYARDVAGHLGTDHTELYVTSDDAREVIPRLPDIYDEPFADSSQIPTFLISELTRRYVTVALSGDGGDELFAGYNRYFWASTIWKQASRIPGHVRLPLSRAMRHLSPASWDALARTVPRRARPGSVGDKAHKFAEILAQTTPDSVYRQLVSHWNGDLAVVKDGFEPLTVLNDPSLSTELPAFLSRMQFLDLVTYLPDDILTKVDRASMAVSLEARVPLLDHRIVELAWRFPEQLKARHGQGKWILRQVLKQYVPARLFDRPKTGFGVPIGAWLRGPLREWAEDLLSERRLAGGGFYHPAPIRRKWREHLSGTRNWQYHLWDVLMFQAWAARWA